ncbi:MAG: hypothetical protein ABIN97_09735 [Ginsengibacter sp.]
MKSIISHKARQEKMLLFLLLVFHGVIFSAYSQVPVINRIEYFLDTDPGYGKATNLSFSGTTDASGIINVNLVPIDQGVHIVGIRSKDANGAWSLDNKWLFVKPYNPGAIIQPDINRVEWYLDNDPGYGNGTALPISSSEDLPNLSFSINMVPLAQGVHIIGVRSKDATGAWSLDNKWIFIKPYAAGAAIQPDITRVEWYLDSDPGYGNGTVLPITSSEDLPGLSFNINMVPLEQGVHIAGIRSRDANGAWSLDNKWIFLKPFSGNVLIQPNINRVEWYLDTDPGYGKATPISISQAQDIPNLAINIALTPLTPGVHIAGIRSRDANGNWSLDNKWIFLKPDPANSEPVPNIVKMEYFIDVDPGYGKASSISITPGTNISMLVFDADISAVDIGTHKLGIRSLDANGAWSLDNEVQFTGGKGNSWIGVTSTSWTTGSNWLKGVVPTASEPVVIPAGTPFSPIIANGVTGNCKSILMQPGAIVTVATGGKLKVNH